jgi:hypothetical protein
MGLMFLVPFALLRLVRSEQLASDHWFWTSMAGLGLVGLLVFFIALRLRLSPDVQTVAGALGVLPVPRRAPLFAAAALGGLTVLLAFTVFVAGRASYSYAGYERPQELLVYSQTGQQTTYTAECLTRIARESGLGHDGLRIFVGESDNFAWQWRWYLRDYAHVSYAFINENAWEAAPDVDIVLFSKAVETKNKGVLEEGFTRIGEINHLWWFPNTAYADLTPKSVIADTGTRKNWQVVTDYFLDRDYGGSMYRSTGVVYVANELAQWADGCTDLRATSDQ